MAHDTLLQQLRAALDARYEIEREVGHGGGATVFAARDRKHDRRVAIKVLHPELAHALGAERFRREIRLVAALTHPHILALHDSGDASGLLYYVMPLVEGETLRERLERERQLPVDDAAAIAGQLAEALAYAHDHGVLHRDVKPENIFLAGEHALIGDFGIARAIHVQPAERLSAAGIVAGTPAYMSPEQASGDPVLGPESDVYSLGCVLFEMLAGEPPFTGPNAQAILARRFAEPAPRVRARRRRVSEELDEVVAQALAPVPADRFTSMRDFAAALPAGQPRRRGAERLAAERRARRRRALAGGGAAAVALALGVAVALGRRGEPVPALDAGLYAVLPFAHDSDAVPGLITGNQCELLLHDALARWSGVRLVNEMRVNDALARRGEDAGPLDFAGAMEIARSLGAGVLVWGHVADVGDSLSVRGVVYDVPARGDGPRAPRTARAVRLAKSLRGAGAAFDALADSLLVGAPRATAAAGGAMGTRSLDAWRAYERGHAALAGWDLPAAATAFQAAAAIDPAYAHASLWLARAKLWSGAADDEWRDAARRAYDHRPRLPERDRVGAEALVAMADGRYPDACRLARALVARDSLDFTAWYTLGDCQARDRAVVRDEASPTGWRFRSSYGAAVHAYERALALVPSVHAAFRGRGFDRLQGLLFTQASRIRVGSAEGAAPSGLFGAYPMLAADTLAFLPRPLGEISAVGPNTIPASTTDAVVANRVRLRGIVRAWVEAFPASADAHEALARVLESLGELGNAAAAPPAGMTPAGSAPTAASAVGWARQLARDPEQQLRLAHFRVRLLVKAGAWEQARALADSLLGAPASARLAAGSPAAAAQLAGLAALTGRAHEAARLSTLVARSDTIYAPDGSAVEMPPAVAEPARALLAYAALGAPADSLAALAARVGRLVDAYTTPERRPGVRAALLDRPAALAFPALAFSASGAAGARADGYLYALLRAASGGDTAETRRRLRGLGAARRAFRPGDVSVDAVLAEAGASLAIGDGAGAAAALDRSLDALPGHGPALLDDVPRAATLVRAMAARADLAAASSDPATARRWAAPVTVLWADASPELRPLVMRMRQLARGN